MDHRIFLASLGLILGGATALGLADLWLSRLMLVYLDAVESNVEKLAHAVRTGNQDIAIAGIDLKRDRRQNLARMLKTVGWLALLLGLVCHIVATMQSSGMTQ